MDPLPSEKPMGGLSDLIGIQKEPIRPVNPFAPKPAGVTPTPQKQTGLRPIRTYESDVAEYVQVGNMSVSKMALAEQNRRIQREQVPQVEPTSNNSNKIIVISISILLFLAAGSIIAYLFLGKSTDTTTSIRVGTTQIKTIILADVQKEIDTAIIDPTRFREVLINERKNTSLPLGKILTPFATKQEGQATVLVPVDQFMDMVGLRPGAQLSRSLDPEFMFGIHSYDGNQPFLILKTRSYGSAFTGMLEWEARLGDDLRDLFIDIPVGTSLPTTWSDNVFENKDIRVLRDGTKTKLLYSLIDKNTIVITTNEQTFKEILSRFYSASLVR
ncbi:MAG: hypothetical protein RLZZ347_640 [Candidatus Parcubacteria bacterium]|jgi:hypothetical protein